MLFGGAVLCAATRRGGHAAGTHADMHGEGRHGRGSMRSQGARFRALESVRRQTNIRWNMAKNALGYWLTRPVADWEA